MMPKEPPKTFGEKGPESEHFVHLLLKRNPQKAFHKMEHSYGGCLKLLYCDFKNYCICCFLHF